MAMLNGLISKLNGDEDGHPKPYGMPGTATNPNTGIAGGASPAVSSPGAPLGGGDRGFEMPGMGSSGGVGDASRMLAEATARNDQLKGIGNRRAQLDIFDRPGHTALDQEESQIFGRPRSSYLPSLADTANTGGPGLVQNAASNQLADLGASAGGGSGPFQSSNTSVRGYLDEAMRAFAPQVKGIADEAGRKSAVEKHLQSLIPEVQKRGGSMSDIRGENATVDGRIIDFFRDIEGAADPQFLDKTDEVRNAGRGGGGPMFGGGSVAPLLQEDASGNIQSALGKFGASQDGGFLQQLIAQLQGGA